MSHNNGILLKGVFNSKLLNNSLGSCVLINLETLLLHTEHFDKTIIFPIVFFLNPVFLFSVYFLFYFLFELFNKQVISSSSIVSSF